MNATKHRSAAMLAFAFALTAAFAHGGPPLDPGAPTCVLHDLGEMAVVPPPPPPPSPEAPLLYGFDGRYARTEFWGDDNRSNTVYLTPDYADSSLIDAAVPDTPAEVGWRPEDRLLHGVNHHLASALAELGHPVSARYEWPIRFDDATRQNLSEWNERKQRTVVLFYLTPAAAGRALESLAGRPGVYQAFGNTRMYPGYFPYPDYTGIEATPLFAFYSPGREDHFYTTSPYSGAAAVAGTMLPTDHPGEPASVYTTVGLITPVIGQPTELSFPNSPSRPGTYPRSQAWLFAGPKNPVDQLNSLSPLYRLSWKCGDGRRTALCAENPYHTDFAYTTDLGSMFANDPASVRRVGYRNHRVDCIEGYLYPKSMPQPPGTVRLLQKYSPERDDHAIFPETELESMTGQGYTVDSGEDWLGYVYPSTNGEPDWLPPMN